ncbi:MAG: hypothetical protein O2912_10360 [Proteobacteria bacterium]|nr:hypothetical protein [Pseudomonadota bacterium]
MKTTFALCLFLLLGPLAPPAHAQAAQAPPKVDGDPETGCPVNRKFLEPKLRIVPADGRLYAVQRHAINMPIDELVEKLGGHEKAYAIARVTKQLTQQKIQSDDYMTQEDRRFHHDTILRLDALITILECRASRTAT